MSAFWAAHLRKLAEMAKKTEMFEVLIINCPSLYFYPAICDFNYLIGVLKNRFLVTYE